MTIAQLYNANNVVVGQAAVYVGASGLALPALTTWNQSDPFAPAFWTTPTGWTAVGATDQGWSYSVDKSTQTINIEEQSTPIATTISSQTVTVAGALSEDITKTLTLALNATSATTAASVGTQTGYDKITMTDDVIYYALGLVTVNKFGFGRLIYLPKVTQLSNPNVAFRRAADKRQYAVNFVSACPIDQIATYEFNATK
jgi:hypothetical protein